MQMCRGVVGCSGGCRYMERGCLRTHMTWKGQLGVWRNLISRMLRWGTVFSVERHQQRSTRLMGLAEREKREGEREREEEKGREREGGRGRWNRRERERERESRIEREMGVSVIPRERLYSRGREGGE